MKEDEKKRAALEQERVELELRREKNSLYTRILMIFGTISILISSIMLLMFNEETNAQSFAMMAIGIFLLITGVVWQFKDDQQLEQNSEDIQHYRDQDLASIRTR